MVSVKEQYCEAIVRVQQQQCNIIRVQQLALLKRPTFENGTMPLHLGEDSKSGGIVLYLQGGCLLMTSQGGFEPSMPFYFSVAIFVPKKGGEAFQHFLVQNFLFKGGGQLKLLMH